MYVLYCQRQQKLYRSENKLIFENVSYLCKKKKLNKTIKDTSNYSIKMCGKYNVNIT